MVYNPYKFKIYDNKKDDECEVPSEFWLSFLLPLPLLFLIGFCWWLYHMDNLEQVSYRTYKHILAAKKEGVITQEEIDEVLADNKITGYEATKLFKKARDRRLTRQHKILREIE